MQFSSICPIPIFFLNFRFQRGMKRELMQILATPITSMSLLVSDGSVPKIATVKSITTKKMATNPVGLYLMFHNPYKIQEPQVPIPLQNLQSKICHPQSKIVPKLRFQNKDIDFNTCQFQLQTSRLAMSILWSSDKVHSIRPNCQKMAKNKGKIGMWLIQC